MSDAGSRGTILVVDDEQGSAIVRTVIRKLEEEGWKVTAIEPEESRPSGEEFEAAALYAIEDELPDGVLLDVRFGEHRDDRFRGLEILRKIVERYPKLPILMFTQYAHGPEREVAVRGTLRWDAPVDFIDKLANLDEVVLRLRRLIGRTPTIIPIGDQIYVDTVAKVVHVTINGEDTPLMDLQGMKFEVLRELAATWYRSPGEVVPFSKLVRYSEGDDPRASLRVRVREIKDSLGKAMSVHFGGGDLIVNVRDQGYLLTPPKM